MGKKIRIKGDLDDVDALLEIIQILKDVSTNRFFAFSQQKNEFSKFLELFLMFFDLMEMVKEFIGRGEALDFSNVNSDVKSMTIKTAMPLLPEEKEAIDKLIKAKLKRDIESVPVEEKKLMAGVVLEFGTLLLDGCFSGAINDTVLAQKKALQEQD